jgi:hypothetical protein
MKITFDSNIWRKVASPDKFPKEPSIRDFRLIKEAIGQEKITPFLCETIFTLEAIQRKDRKDFFSDYSPKFNTKVQESENGMIELSFSMEPDPSAHPGNNPYLESYLKDSSEIGFKIIELPRISGVTNPDIDKYFYKHNDLAAYHDKVIVVGRKTEERQAGIFHIKEIGLKYPCQWTKGIEVAPDHEEGNIAKAIAEWADGDSVVCHIAVGGKYFCTRDNAQTAGDKSVLSQDNIEWLKKEYDFEIISPEDLSIKIK